MISLEEMHARTDRAIEEVLKDNELKQFGNPNFTLEKTRKIERGNEMTIRPGVNIYWQTCIWRMIRIE